MDKLTFLRYRNSCSGILTVIKWARHFFHQSKSSLSDSWDKCFNKTQKNSYQKIEHSRILKKRISDFGLSDLSSDGEALETDLESEASSCMQAKSRITKIQQKKLLMCNAELNIRKMLEENGKDIDRYIKHFQSFISQKKGKKNLFKSKLHFDTLYK